MNRFKIICLLFLFACLVEGRGRRDRDQDHDHDHENNEEKPNIDKCSWWEKLYEKLDEKHKDTEQICMSKSAILKHLDMLANLLEGGSKKLREVIAKQMLEENVSGESKETSESQNKKEEEKKDDETSSNSDNVKLGIPLDDLLKQNLPPFPQIDASRWQDIIKGFKDKLNLNNQS